MFFGRLWDKSCSVYIYLQLGLSKNSACQGLAYVFSSIALIVEFIGFVQFIGWVGPSCILNNVVSDGIISKLQCSMSYVKRAMNRIPACEITLFQARNGVEVLLYTFWHGYFRRRWQCEGLFTPFRTFLHSEKKVISAFMGHDLTSIDILRAQTNLDLLVLYVLACYVRSDM